MRAVPENVLDGFSLSAFGAEIRIDLPRCMAPICRPKVAADDALENSVGEGVVPKGGLVCVFFFRSVLKVAGSSF